MDTGRQNSTRYGDGIRTSRYHWPDSEGVFCSCEVLIWDWAQPQELCMCTRKRLIESTTSPSSPRLKQLSYSIFNLQEEMKRKTKVGGFSVGFKCCSETQHNPNHSAGYSLGLHGSAVKTKWGRRNRAGYWINARARPRPGEPNVTFKGTAATKHRQSMWHVSKPAFTEHTNIAVYTYPCSGMAAIQSL